MSDDNRNVFIVLVAALLLWWLWKRRRAAVTVAPAVGPPTVAPTPPAAANAAPAPVTRAPPIDVSGGISDGAADILQDNGTRAGMGAWQEAFYDQVWLPASKVRLSSLTPEDWAYARAFLENAGGEFTRRDDIGLLGKLLVANTQSGAITFNTVIGSVAQLIPIFGAAWGKVTQVQNQALAEGQAWDTAMGNGALGSLLRDSLSSPTAQTRHLLANYADGSQAAKQNGEFVDGPDAALDRRIMHLPELIPLGQMQNFDPPSAVWTVRGKKFRPRLRLFTKYQGGWILPWLCWHFNGDTTESYGCKQVINTRARVYRAVDAIIAQFAPYVREHAPYGYWADASTSGSWPVGQSPRFPGAADTVDDRTLYYYKNPLLGPMLGSIFPPTAEDTRYVGSDGRTYSYYGEPIDNPKGSIGALSDRDVDPNAPKGVVSVPIAVVQQLAGGGIAAASGAPPPMVTVPISVVQQFAGGGLLAEWQKEHAQMQGGGSM